MTTESASLVVLSTPSRLATADWSRAQSYLQSLTLSRARTLTAHTLTSNNAATLRQGYFDWLATRARSFGYSVHRSELSPETGPWKLR